MKSYQAVMIGFGKGAKTLAGALAEAGEKVAVIEQSENMYGGTCINAGCIPSKSLVRSAELSELAGGSFEEKAARYTAAVKEKERLTGALRDKNYHKLNDHPNIDVINGRASFTGARTLKVETGDHKLELNGEKIFINTGARPFIPPVKGLRESRRALTSEGLLNLTRLPEKLVIIGGGYIGMEFASMYSSFGSHVTVVQDGSTFLPREDREIARAVLERLNKKGVEVLFSAQIREVKDEEAFSTLVVSAEGESQVLEADAILIATGRRPNVEGLNLEAAGVELTGRGAVKTDEYRRTTADRIWAMGDVAGGLQFTYISLDDYRIVKSQLLGGEERSEINRGAVPYSVFLDPPFSRVGLSEQEAVDQGSEVKIAKMSAAAIPKAQVLSKPDGLLKIIIDAKTDKILGAHLFCAESYEMINLLKLAMDAGLPYQVLRDGIYTHPTMTEALNDLLSSVK